MIPIFTVSDGQMGGYSNKEFMRRFDHICQNHLSTKRARSFAFIFYNPEDENIKGILENKGAWAELHLISGHEMSIFYFSGTKHSDIIRFNRYFLSGLEIEESYEMPFILFFKFRGDEVEDREIVELTRNNSLLAFTELTSYIRSYIQENKEPGNIHKLWPPIKYLGKIAIEKVIGDLMGEGYKKAFE